MSRKQIARRRGGGAPPGTQANDTAYKPGHAASSRGRPPGAVNFRTREIAETMLAASRNIGREAAWRFLKEAEEKNADDKDYIAYAKEKIKNTEDLVWFWETVGAVNIVKLGEMLSRLVPREHKLDVQQQTVIDFSGTPEQVRDRIEQRYRVRLPPTLKLITNKEPEPPTIDANGIEVSES